MVALYTNNASTLLASGITALDTTITVTIGQGAQFPNPTGGDFFMATIQSITNSNREIVKCTSRTGDVLTVVRAQEGTTAYAFNANDIIELRVTAGELTVYSSVVTNTGTVAITAGTITGITDLAVADGGTGASSITANSVILGNGSSALNGNLVAPGSSGNVLTSNGTTWTSAAPTLGARAQAFTSSGTFTVPTGVTAVKITAIAGGGGGAGGTNNLPGVGGGPGGAGGTSSFGSYVVATGGGGGAWSFAPVPGGPGSVTAGTYKNIATSGSGFVAGSNTGYYYPIASTVMYGNGGNGADMSYLPGIDGGGGGGGPVGIGWATGLTPGGTVSVTVGGGGSAGGPGSSGAPGNVGAAGFVIVEW